VKIVEHEDIVDVNRGSIKTFPPGSRDRQDQMTTIRYAGEFFHITTGGAANNCTDMLMSKARENLKKEAEKLQKEKDEILEREELVKTAKTKLNEVTNDNNLRLEDLKICIMWKKNLKKRPTGNKDAIRKIWDACKNYELPEEKVWTTANENRLNKLGICKILHSQPNLSMQRQ